MWKRRVKKLAWGSTFRKLRSWHPAPSFHFLVCCSLWGCKELDMSERLNWTELMGPDATILVFWMLSLKPTFSLSSFTFTKRLFSSSLISALNVASSAYLRSSVGLVTIKKSLSDECWVGCGETGTPHTVGGNVTWCCRWGWQYGGSLKPKNRATT